MNITQQKISKTSKLVSNILRAGLIFSIGAAILFMFGIIFFIAKGDVSSLYETFKISAIESHMPTPTISTLITLFSFAIITLLMIAKILHILYHIFSDIAITYTPFKTEYVNRIKHVAFLALLICIIGNVFEAIGETLLYSTNITTININFIGFVQALVIYCIAHIFEYGCQLQQQSDETL